jgi:hypothetical protein
MSEILKNAYHKECFFWNKCASVFEWHESSQEGQGSVQDDEWIGCPSGSITE